MRVHGTEVSTDGDAFNTYAETLTLLAAIVAFVAAAWVVAQPMDGAQLTVPAEQGAAIAAFDLVAGGEAIQPDPFGPTETIVRMDPVEPGATPVPA